MSVITFPGYKLLVEMLLFKNYGIDINTIDTSPLRDWFLQGMTPEEAAKTLAIKDGFPE